jgi:hypothetical protein
MRKRIKIIIYCHLYNILQSTILYYSKNLSIFKKSTYAVLLIKSLLHRHENLWFSRLITN